MANPRGGGSFARGVDTVMFGKTFRSPQPLNIVRAETTCQAKQPRQFLLSRPETSWARSKFSGSISGSRLRERRENCLIVAQKLPK